MNVEGIILAAGASSRMGCPKAIATINGKTFLQLLVDSLRCGGVEDIVVVLGGNADRVSPTLSWFDGTVVTNTNWRAGQLSSIAIGLDAMKRVVDSAAIICPVDHPLVSSELIAKLIAAHKTTHKEIVLPSCNGRRGHPVLFSSNLFRELKTADTRIGARQIVRGNPDKILEVATTDTGVLLNLDTPEATRAHWTTSR